MVRLVPSCKSLSVIGGAVLAAVLLPASVAAQLNWGGEPVSRHAALRVDVPSMTMEAVNVAEYLAEDVVAPKNVPFRFGATLPVDLGFDNAGVWETLANGDRVWRLRISSPGAYTLSAIFSRFVLPGGSSLWVYNDDQSQVLGAYDDRNNQDDGEFAFEPLTGDAMTLEYYEPAPVAHKGQLRLRSVIHDYRDINALTKEQIGPGDAAGSCEVDIMCPQGAAWQNQKRAVTLLLIGGGACTGALINNTSNNGTQYYMSAYHCGALNTAVFRFNYERPGCSSGTAPTTHSVSGSTQMAGNASLDFRLVKITSPIPASYSPYYLGWDRSGTAIPSNTLCIHHPEADVKKISFDNAPPAKSGSQWYIQSWETGATEPGSSGSPLMNSLGRFIGQLYGGDSSCSFVFNDFYGRFDLAWSSVASVLDPTGTGSVAIDGFDPGGSVAPPTLTSVSPGTVKAFAGGTITLTGTHFLSATKVTTGSVQLVSPGLDFTAVSDTQITYTAPTASALGSTSVTVSNSGGTSAAKTFTYVETNPPTMLVAPFATAGQPFSWNWAAGASDTAYLLYSLNNATFNYGGFPILANLHILSSSTLSPVGLGGLTINMPAAASGILLFSQIATLDGVSGAFVGASAVFSTLIL